MHLHFHIKKTILNYGPMFLLGVSHLKDKHNVLTLDFPFSLPSDLKDIHSKCKKKSNRAYLG